MTFLCIYTHPKVKSRVKPFITELFFEERHLNPYYKPPQIQTAFEVDLLETFNTEKWKYKLVDDESLVTTLKKAKKSVVMLTIVLTKISGFFEKLKNIVMWQDHRRSLIFVFCTLVGYCIFAIVPMRFIIFVAGKIEFNFNENFLGWAKFIKGIFYFKNLRNKNRAAATKTINFIINKNFPDIANQIAENPTAPWPTTVNFNTLQKRVLNII